MVLLFNQHSLHYLQGLRVSWSCPKSPITSHPSSTLSLFFFVCEPRLETAGATFSSILFSIWCIFHVTSFRLSAIYKEAWLLSTCRAISRGRGGGLGLELVRQRMGDEVRRGLPFWSRARNAMRVREGEWTGPNRRANTSKPWFMGNYSQSYGWA